MPEDRWSAALTSVTGHHSLARMHRGSSCVPGADRGVRPPALVSRAGLVAAMALARRSGLTELADHHLTVADMTVCARQDGPRVHRRVGRTPRSKADPCTTIGRSWSSTATQTAVHPALLRPRGLGTTAVDRGRQRHKRATCKHRATLSPWTRTWLTATPRGGGCSAPLATLPGVITLPTSQACLLAAKPRPLRGRPRRTLLPSSHSGARASHSGARVLSRCGGRRCRIPRSGPWRCRRG